MYSEWTSVGMFTSDCSGWTEPTAGNGFLVTYFEGRATKADIAFVCTKDRSAFRAIMREARQKTNPSNTYRDSGFTFLTEQPQGQYHFEWQSPKACPIGKGGGGDDDDGGLSWGWICIIV